MVAITPWIYFLFSLINGICEYCSCLLVFLPFLGHHPPPHKHHFQWQGVAGVMGVGGGGMDVDDDDDDNPRLVVFPFFSILGQLRP